jgi:hypothetical protein
MAFVTMERNGQRAQVSQRSFDKVWSNKGWTLVDGESADNQSGDRQLFSTDDTTDVAADNADEVDDVEEADE